MNTVRTCPKSAIGSGVRAIPGTGNGWRKKRTCQNQLVANAVVGFWEEHEASNSIEALKAKLAVKARVKRDGKWINPPARELVPGDVIRLRLGDIVPADARLLAKKQAIVSRLRHRRFGRVKQWGTTVLLTDGDVVFNPAKWTVRGFMRRSMDTP
jgi:hypothetical protein